MILMPSFRSVWATIQNPTGARHSHGDKPLLRDGMVRIVKGYRHAGPEHLAAPSRRLKGKALALPERSLQE